MVKPKFSVDFNELIEANLVMLSQNDIKLDSEGNRIELFDGFEVMVYELDLDENGNSVLLIANGIVEKNTIGGWTKNCKWNFRIDVNGINHDKQE